MQLGLVLSLLAFGFLSLEGCKSVSKHEGSDISGMEVGADANEEAEAEAETFAMFGSKRIDAAFQKTQAALASFPQDFKLDDALALSTELSDLRDLLEIFVHIFPIKAGDDQLIVIHEQLNQGIDLLSGFAKLHDADKIKAARPAILSFAGRISAPDQKLKMLEYFESINRVYATRRSIPILNNTCWAKVDFIPRLSSPAEQELHDFMKALLRATRSEATEALKLEEITAVEQTASFQSTRLKARHVLMLQRHFPEITKGDEDLLKSLNALKDLSVRYEAIHELLEERDTVLAGAGSVSLLDKKILRDWAETKSWQIRSGSF